MQRILSVLFSLSICACGSTSDDPQTTAGQGLNPYVVEIQQVDYGYAIPASIPSGWITFRAPNAGKEHHVAVILKLPDGLTASEWHEGVAAFHESGTRPEWWTTMQDAGGTGVVASGLTAETTMWMEPGLYGVLCGVIAPDGISHWGHGMRATFEVTSEPSGAPEPAATIRLSLSDDGFEQEGTVTAGTHTVAVHFAEQGDVTHDVHVARLGTDGTLQMAVSLMARPIEPFPFPFVGGAEQGPEGRTDYFTVTFEPGRYAWVCHLHAGKGMVREFLVE